MLTNKFRLNKITTNPSTSLQITIHQNLKIVREREREREREIHSKVFKFYFDYSYEENNIFFKYSIVNKCNKE